MAPFLPNSAQQLAEILGVTLPANGPEGGPDGWCEAAIPLLSGAPLQQPKVLFPKLDKDHVAELAEAHIHGEAC